jgi:hypothetical protein
MSRDSSCHDAERWRARAEEMLAIAEDMKDIHVKAIRHNIAEDYLRLFECAQIRALRDKRKTSP